MRIMTYAKLFLFKSLVFKFSDLFIEKLALHLIHRIAEIKVDIFGARGISLGYAWKIYSLIYKV